MVLVCVLGTPVVKGAGLVPPAGLKGEYFNDTWCYGSAVVTRIDSEINVDWGDGEPAPGVEVDYFSVRWTGDLEIPVTATYIFTVRTDGDVLLRIGDKTLIGQYGRTTTNYQGQVELTAGQVYPIELICNAGKGKVAVQLLWESPTRPQEIVPAAVLQLPLRARTPVPAEGAAEVPMDVTLQWKAGCRAMHHDVYFGADVNAVANATPMTAGVYQGRQTLDETAFTPAPLDWEKVYYWRVDEVNDNEPSSPWKGRVWSLTTGNFLLIDDFESYTDLEGHYMWETWIDGWDNGTGSTVGYLVEGDWLRGLSIVREGEQLMPFDYNNANPPHYSEAYRTWDIPRDWTVNGVSDLSLWLRGEFAAFHAKSDQEIVVSATGTNAKDLEDVFRFAFKQINGDGWIIARIDKLRNARTGARAGVMVRESAGKGSRYVAVAVTADQSLSFEHRLTENGGLTSTYQPGVHTPCWVRLARAGSEFTAAYSGDGISWHPVTGVANDRLLVNIAMPAAVCLGVCVAGHDYWTTTAEFSGVSTMGDVASAWQVADIPWLHPGNWPDGFYVALQDAGGKMTVAVHPDPAISVLTEWTQWKVPLSGFAAAGVDLKSIQRMYIGVGDRNSSQPNGSGRIWIDDIRVVRSTSQP